MTDSAYTIKQNTVQGLVSALDGKAAVDLSNSPYTTNRILEIPQDIKLELNNGSLVRKAGSKFYIPNGFEQDGTTPKFDVITSISDISNKPAVTSNNLVAFLAGSDVNSFGFVIRDACYSGSTAPSGQTTMLWYDTTNNIVKLTSNGGSNWYSGFSLPYAICTCDASNGVTSIDQIFNGFGYIGSTLFLLPGVKTVVPDGRNDDGTCKNKAPSTVTAVKTRTMTAAGTAYMFTNYASSVIAIHGYVCSKTKPTVTTTTLWYNPETNLPSQVLSNGNITTPYWEIPIAKFTSDSTGKITSFEPYTVDSVVNSNEFYQLKDNAVTLTDNQTISGSKTFTSNIRQVQNGSDTEIVLYDTGLASASVQPTSSRCRAFRVRASNGDILGDVRFMSNIGRVAALLARKVIGTTTHSPSISVTCDYLGNEYASCPTSPWPNDNSTRIATTAWVNTANKTGYGIGAPNYSAAVDITINSSTSYTATENGWIQVSLPDSYGYIYIDGVVFALSITASGYYSTYQAGIAPIAKGSSVTTNNAANLAIKFIPCK